MSKSKRPAPRMQMNIYIRPDVIERIKFVVRWLPHAIPGSSASDGSVIESIVEGKTTLEAMEILIRENVSKKTLSQLVNDK